MTDQSDKMNRSSMLSNKYLMACVIAKRARQLSDNKGRMILDEAEPYFNPILYSIREIEEGKIRFSVPETSPAVALKGDEAENVPGVEEGS